MNNLKIKKLFIAGTDTGVGKTEVTGLIARSFIEKNVNVITSKPVQTGCNNISEDLLKHRKLMGVALYPEDHTKITCPYVLKKPCSPELAAEIEDEQIDETVLVKNIEILAHIYDLVLIEGAGGLMVPLNKDLFLVDLVKKENYPVILVASSRVGGINHTLLSIEKILAENITLFSLVLNHFDNEDEAVKQNTEMILKKYLLDRSPSTLFFSINHINDALKETESIYNTLVGKKYEN